MSEEEAVNDTLRPDWVGQRAIAWVIDEAPVSAELAWTLVVIARRCNPNGEGSYQSIPTLAEKTGKSEDQVRRDVAKLLDLGLIKLGDQSLPEKNKVPPGKRPVVYDVVLNKIGPKPVRQSKNKSGKKKPESESTPGFHARGGMEATPTPGMHAATTPCMDATQTTLMNNPLEQPQREMPAKQASRQRAEDEGWRMMTVLRSYKPAEARYLIDALTNKYGIFSANWWKEAHQNSTLDDRIREVIDEYKENHAAQRANGQEDAA